MTERKHQGGIRPELLQRLEQRKRDREQKQRKDVLEEFAAVTEHFLRCPGCGNLVYIDHEFPFRVTRNDGTDVLAHATKLLIARGAYREAADMYPEDAIELREGAQVIERSK
jgi:hypothetical protein